MGQIVKQARKKEEKQKKKEEKRRKQGGKRKKNGGDKEENREQHFSNFANLFKIIFYVQYEYSVVCPTTNSQTDKINHECLDLVFDLGKPKKKFLHVWPGHKGLTLTPVELNGHRSF